MPAVQSAWDPVIKKGKDGRPHMLYGMACAGTVAWVMYQKFCNALPYFRQEKDWKQYGASITRKHNGKLGDPEFGSFFPSNV